ncbi:hypothetical protein GCM10022207_45080 [Streptomyces lannensis]|uniref:Uncharacterized protein n=1 Tax=Streptomyces lannensis TaxID=766498 RepID=A0ABP7KGC0_9ACTN
MRDIGPYERHPDGRFIEYPPFPGARRTFPIHYDLWVLGSHYGVWAFDDAARAAPAIGRPIRLRERPGRAADKARGLCVGPGRARVPGAARGKRPGRKRLVRVPGWDPTTAPDGGTARR